MEHLRFEDMQLSKEIYQAVLDRVLKKQRPIQSQAIPLVKAAKTSSVSLRQYRQNGRIRHSLSGTYRPR